MASNLTCVYEYNDVLALTGSPIQTLILLQTVTPLTFDANIISNYLHGHSFQVAHVIIIIISVNTPFKVYKK